LTIPDKYELWGMRIGVILRSVGIGALILAGIFWLQRQYTYVSWIRKAFSWTCLVLGAFFLFLYGVNLIFGVYQNPILISGSILLVFGCLLRKIKVPVKN
jgi:hypothetical protein